MQFYARHGEPRFGVEARYQHPKESLADDAAVAKATSFLRDNGFACRRDGSGHHWPRLVAVDEVIVGAESHDQLVAFIRHTVQDLVGSGLFEALAARTPSGPAADSETLDADA